MTLKKENKSLKLKVAVQSYLREKGAPSNAHDWYRRCAQRHGYIPIANIHVPAYKYKGTWHVNTGTFNKAIKEHRNQVRHLNKITNDYAKGIIHGKDGDVVRTEWGGYEIHGDFRFDWSDYERARRKSNGTWYCNRCGIPAETEHDKEKCHRCQDWNGCGSDCTLSRVYCLQCGASINI